MMKPVYMRRSKVNVLTIQAAFRAGLSEQERGALASYILNPNVIHIAHGDWEFEGCQCPATGAGLVHKVHRLTLPRVLRFAGEWDRLVDNIIGTGFHIVELV